MFPKILAGTLLGLGVVGGAVVGSDCANTGIPQPVTPDGGSAFLEEVACIEANISSWSAILANCSQYPIAELEAVLQWLIANPQTSSSERFLLEKHLKTLRAGQVLRRDGG